MSEFFDNGTIDNNDFRETKIITLRKDAKDINVIHSNNDTHINYTSESHPNKHCIEVVIGLWDEYNKFNNIVTLKEQ